MRNAREKDKPEQEKCAKNGSSHKSLPQQKLLDLTDRRALPRCRDGLPRSKSRRDVLAPMLGYEARVSITLASLGGPCYERNRLALVEKRLSFEIRCKRKSQQKTEKNSSHGTLLSVVTKAQNLESVTDLASGFALQRYVDSGGHIRWEPRSSIYRVPAANAMLRLTTDSHSKFLLWTVPHVSLILFWIKNLRSINSPPIETVALQEKAGEGDNRTSRKKRPRQPGLVEC
jgi:hypothetical protein